MARRKWHWEIVFDHANETTGKKYWKRVKVYDPPEIQEPKEGSKEPFMPPRWIDKVIEGEEKRDEHRNSGGTEQSG
jgi:hypothetical protein